MRLPLFLRLPGLALSHQKSSTAFLVVGHCRLLVARLRAACLPVLDCACLALIGKRSRRASSSSFRGRPLERPGRKSPSSAKDVREVLEAPLRLALRRPEVEHVAVGDVGRRAQSSAATAYEHPIAACLSPSYRLEALDASFYLR